MMTQKYQRRLQSVINNSQADGISIRLHHVHGVIHLANRLFKCLWVVITAFPLAPLSSFVGKHSFLCQTSTSKIKVAVWKTFYFLFCTCVAFGQRFRVQHCCRNTLRTFSSSFLLKLDLRPFGWPETDFLSFSLFKISLPLEVDWGFSKWRQDYL